MSSSDRSKGEISSAEIEELQTSSTSCWSIASVHRELCFSSIASSCAMLTRGGAGGGLVCVALRTFVLGCPLTTIVFISLSSNALGYRRQSSSTPWREFVEKE